jgi:hypothetical protein
VAAPSVPLVLKRGGTIEVSGDSEPGVFSRIYVQTGELRDGEQTDPDRWLPQPGCVLVNTQVPPGPLLLRLIAFDNNNVTHFGAAVAAESRPGETHTLRLPLRPGRRVAGFLDPSVPRPVQNGRVHIHVSTPVESAGGSMKWDTWMNVEADGTFVFNSLPEGAVELIAICDGFVSKNPPGGETARVRRPQVFENEGVAVTVQMEPAGTCKARVVDSSGKPLAGAYIHFSPNVGWSSRRTGIFAHQRATTDELLRMDREAREKSFRELWRSSPGFSDKTDYTGHAVIANLPAGEHPFHANLQGYRMQGAADDDAFPHGGPIVFSPGETREITIVMRRDAGDVKSAGSYLL